MADKKTGEVEVFYFTTPVYRPKVEKPPSPKYSLSTPIQIWVDTRPGWLNRFVRDARIVEHVPDDLNEENFAPKEAGVSEKTARLLVIHSEALTKQVVRLMHRHHLRPADIWETCGAIMFDHSAIFTRPIIALASARRINGGELVVPYFGENDQLENTLNLYEMEKPEDTWATGFGFMAVESD